MTKSDMPTTLEEAVRRKSINTWEFYSAVTGHDRFPSNLVMGEIHPFKFNRNERNLAFMLVLKLRDHYEEAYSPEEQTRQYYMRPINDIIEAYKFGTLKQQKKAVARLLVSIAYD